MKIGIYSVRDALVGFSTPFYARNDGEAHRLFANSANAGTPNIVNTNPEDKELFKLGSFDEETGELEKDLRFIVSAKAVIKEEPANASEQVC